MPTIVHPLRTFMKMSPVAIGVYDAREDIPVGSEVAVGPVEMLFYDHKKQKFVPIFWDGFPDNEQRYVIWTEYLGSI